MPRVAINGLGRIGRAALKILLDADGRYHGILGVSEDPLVSADIVGDPRAAVIDLDLTRVVDATLVKVMAWYDNKWGFTHQMIREARITLGVAAT
ncbi:hypothetical protein AB0H88_47985 [Nonomuraea sp. NPDC050680]|uniref:hypothetical protein n=1 Tax=Nonomuraea sp. NPDC050680 TaxID=3154630 RepID=UPI0033DA5240